MFQNIRNVSLLSQIVKDNVTYNAYKRTKLSRIDWIDY